MKSTFDKKNMSSYILPLSQSKLETTNRKGKSWKGVTSIRKSAILNKASVPLAIEIDLLNEES